MYTANVASEKAEARVLLRDSELLSQISQQPWPFDEFLNLLEHMTMKSNLGMFLRKRFMFCSLEESPTSSLDL